MTIQHPALADIRLSEILGAFSYALDATEGQPRGHCVRACWIGSQIGEAIGLKGVEAHELYYTLLLKDLGCTSNAARVCQLYLADDLEFKREAKLLNSGVGPALAFVFKHTGLEADLASRLGAIVNIMRHGGDITRELFETRCQRGADIARKLRFSENVAGAIASLDEHWDGAGHAEGLSGQDIPLYSRIALLSQVVDVFHTSAGRAAAEAEIAHRAGRWFDPELAACFAAISDNDRFWSDLADPTLDARVFALEPGEAQIRVTDDYLDDIAAAFGQVVDAKSPFTAGHSSRVGLYTGLLCNHIGIPDDETRWIRRGALLHDIGKLAISNSLLDKPGKLEGKELEVMRSHARLSGEILTRISAFSAMAPIAAAHHERLDGAGYPLNLKGDQIAPETRIISVADFFDALTADRPYRKAMTVEKSLEIMANSTGSAIDPDVFQALREILDKAEGLPASPETNSTPALLRAIT